jgi:hypothetical protein
MGGANGEVIDLVVQDSAPKRCCAGIQNTFAEC